MADILIDNEAMPSTPASGKSIIYVDSVSKKLSQLDDGGSARGVLSRNFSTASQGAGFAVDTYVTNSGLLIPNCGIQTGQVYRWYITLSKTAAGTAQAVFTFRLGAAQTTADTSLLALTQVLAQTAAVSSGVLVCSVHVRTAGATGVVAGAAGVAASAGFGSGQDGVSGSVNLASAAGQFLGLSMNGGASAAWTITGVTAELIG